MTKLSVVVGVYDAVTGKAATKERTRLANLIEDLGFQVERTLDPWPRDEFVFLCDNTYLIRKTRPPADDEIAEGGNVLLGSDFAMCSAHIFARASQRAYGRRTYPAPTGKSTARPVWPNTRFNHNHTHALPHIDLSCLLVPSAKLLLVDGAHYAGAPEDLAKFQLIAEAEGLTLINYEESPETSHRYFPLNALVIPPENGGKELIIANKNAPGLVGLLKDRGVEVVDFDMRTAPKWNYGSIRCCTNLKAAETPLDPLISETYWAKGFNKQLPPEITKLLNPHRRARA